MIQSSGQPHEEYARLLLSTGSFPDVAGSLNIDRASFFRPDVLAALPLDDDARLIRNVEGETTDGALYAYTPFSQPISLVYYNKDMFAAAGITEEMLPPADMAAFEAMLYQVRDAGMVPMAVANSWAAGWAYFQLTQPTVFLENENWYIDRAAGDVTFAGGPWNGVRNGSSAGPPMASSIPMLCLPTIPPDKPSSWQARPRPGSWDHSLPPPPGTRISRSVSFPFPPKAGNRW